MRPQAHARRRVHGIVGIPVSGTLRSLLQAIRNPDSLYLFVDPRSGKPYAEDRLGHVWEAIRDAPLIGLKLTDAQSPGVEGLQQMDGQLTIRALRQSCVVQLARAECTVPEIAAITGHSPQSVNSILTKYLPRDAQVALNAQRKRGLLCPRNRERTNKFARQFASLRLRSANSLIYW